MHHADTFALLYTLCHVCSKIQGDGHLGHVLQVEIKICETYRKPLWEQIYELDRCKRAAKDDLQRAYILADGIQQPKLCIRSKFYSELSVGTFPFHAYSFSLVSIGIYQHEHADE